MFIVDSNLVCFIVIAILFLFLGEWLVSEGYLGSSVANFIAVSIINFIEFGMSDCILHFEFREIELLPVYFLNVLRKIGFEYLHFENFTQSQILPDWYNYFFNNEILDLHFV